MRTCWICTKEFESKCRNARYCSGCSPLHYKKQSILFKSKRVKFGANAYSQMKQRCENTNSLDYRFYGAKGIKIFITKEDFCLWYSNIDKCSICKCILNTDKTSKGGKCVDRIDSDKDYSKENIRILCRSCNTKTSANKQFGKRPTKEKLLETLSHNKKTTEIAKIFNVNYNAVLRWYKYYNIERPENVKH